MTTELIQTTYDLAPAWTGDAGALASRALHDSGLCTGPTARIDVLEHATELARRALAAQAQEPQEHRDPPNISFVMPFDPKMVGRVVNALARRYRFSDGSVMPLGEYLEKRPPLYRKHSVRLYALAKRNGSYAKLRIPKDEYSVWWADETGIDVPKIVWDALPDIPERKSDQ